MKILRALTLSMALGALLPTAASAYSFAGGAGAAPLHPTQEVEQRPDTTGAVLHERIRRGTAHRVAPEPHRLVW
jgi:hypothetical protein